MSDKDLNTCFHNFLIMDIVLSMAGVILRLQVMLITELFRLLFMMPLSGWFELFSNLNNVLIRMLVITSLKSIMPKPRSSILQFRVDLLIQSGALFISRFLVQMNL